MFNRHSNAACREEAPPFNPPYMADNDNALNVLLVEDNYSDMVLMVQRMNATHIPYHLDRIANGDGVMPYLTDNMEKRPPDIIFLDLSMPGTNGFDILQSLACSSALMRAVPIAIVTGMRHFDYLSASYRDLPIYGCLSKPLKVDDLVPILSKAMP